MVRLRLMALAAGATAVAFGMAAQAEATTSILFVVNSFTFGRVDPVMSYNASNVHDLTAPSNGGTFSNLTGSNPYEPHPWGGVAGIFKMFTTELGMDYDVSISARNGASLRGQLLNSNPAGWDLRGNIASQKWDNVVLQELSDGALPTGKTANASLGYFKEYASKIADFVHNATTATTFRDTDFFGSASKCAAATGASTTSCNTIRALPANANANPDSKVYLYQTWARPDLVTGAVTSITDPDTGAVTRTTIPGPGIYADVQGMTDDLHSAYFGLATDTSRFAGVAPVGDAFQRAVSQGLATSDPYASDAATDGKIDLWWDDNVHASTYGSYLSALTLFGTVTGADPLSLGGNERAAADLGINSTDAITLQRVASQQLGFAAAAVPEPATWSMMLVGFGMVGAASRHRRRSTATTSA